MFGGRVGVGGVYYNDIYIIKLTKDTVVSNYIPNDINLDTNLSVPLQLLNFVLELLAIKIIFANLSL